MKDSTRRVALFIIIVGAGSVLVLFDVPVLLLLAGVIFLVILILILSGTVKIPSIKTLKLKRKEKAQKTPAEKKSPVPPKKEKNKRFPDRSVTS